MFTVNFEARKAMTIKASSTELKEYIGDFNTWRTWSPWICQEVSAKTFQQGTPNEVGHAQGWDGRYVGKGEMKLTGKGENNLTYIIDFIKPWKSKSDVEFIFNKVSDTETEVVWTLKGQLPFFMFWMKKMMGTFVECDYKRGLMMLKDKFEKGEVLAKSTLEGVQDGEEIFYLGFRDKCSTEEMETAMQPHIDKLHKLLEEGKLEKPDHFLSIYHNFDMVKQICDYTIGFGYKEKTDPLEEMAQGHLPVHKRLTSTHQGSYHHLGNTWMQVMSAQRTDKHKMNKKVPIYELYLNNPTETAEKDLLTSVCVPIIK